VHFLRNFIRPFGDFSSAVRIVDFCFFFWGLMGEVDDALSVKDLCIKANAVAIKLLLLDEADLAAENSVFDDEAVDGVDCSEDTEVRGKSDFGGAGDGGAEGK
jgi:hypothetical protein